ncbi:uncharacterized protein Z518_06037 [Rhinocladiella mackenziei CBS 650.93]|uniref:Uncharacterized protein n=1 Tax=Rhinocladiella mackenziei CBS 650.93 TaxID=1442369 RepID=A0A0D2J7Z1_9EURO|nr:uncharacterized protein Z518_06037 [Rhinocladiella mackenziei CBS 650.93]KIX05165.1 hypothetical protein Z518_06037 [Rhinocladiella mackenziei CBS 650.93]
MFRFKSAISTLGGGHGAPVDIHPDEVQSGEEEDQVRPLPSPAPSTVSDTMSVPVIPPWVRELNNSRTTRHSRASSVVSTRTKFSTTTLQEDARSIDINVGGQYFRISRDGSRITADAPPPYTGPGETIRFQSGQANGAPNYDSQYAFDERDQDASDPEDGAVTPTSTSAVRANILDPTEFHMPSPVGHEQLNHRSSSATLVDSARTADTEDVSDRRSSYEAGDDVLSIDMQGRSRTRPPSEDAPRATRNSMHCSSSVRRGNRLQLPTLITSTDNPRIVNRFRRYRRGSAPCSGRPFAVRSAGPVLSGLPDSREPRSPDYIGRNANGVFPLPVRSATTRQSGFTEHHGSTTTASRTEGRPFEDSDAPVNNHTPLPMDNENDISLHYARMMRKLDYGHRKILHLKDKELAELRMRLHEKDIVLRQQLRAKDFLIDDLKTRLVNLEENMETMLEKARNQVEDLWECRWKDRDFHLRERMRRIEEEAQRTIERIRTGQSRTNEEPTTPLAE